MCDKAVDGCLAELKFIPHWFVASEMLEKFHDSLSLTMILVRSHFMLMKWVFLV